MIKNIEISKISPHPDNPRKDLGDLTELADSIKKQGILQNLTVVPYIGEVTGEPMEDMYRVVIGHRRLAAAKLAGLSEVPCAIVNMTLQEQIAAMLLENIQRNDLTVYEQAQGFQLMLDLGETVNDIAEKTGFSERTIRRRTKLLELDKDKFRASVERGATLYDYIELDKIQDIKLKNSVLDKIGTPNFKYELQRAIDKEKSEKNMALLAAELEKFATKVDDGNGMQYVKTYYASNDDKVDVPEDAKTTEYFFVVSKHGYVTLYTKNIRIKIDTAEAEKQNELREHRAGLEEITKRAYRLRQEFVRDYSSAKKHMHDLLEYAVRLKVGDNTYMGFDHEMFIDLLGIKMGDEDELTFENVVEQFNVSPERVFLITIYCELDSAIEHYYTWDCSYNDNETLNMVYDFLEKLGYEMSDEERALREGTHELFNELKEAGDDEEQAD